MCLLGRCSQGPAPQEVPNCDVFHPDWPSISPYVTAVGSTYITPIAEKACFAPESTGAPDCTTNPLSEVLLSTDTGMPWTASTRRVGCCTHAMVRAHTHKVLVRCVMVHSWRILLLHCDSIVSEGRRGGVLDDAQRHLATRTPVQRLWPCLP